LEIRILRQGFFTEYSTKLNIQNAISYFYFYQILTASSFKLKIMSEVAHDNWTWLQTIYRFLKLVFDRKDSSLEYFNRAIQNYGCWQLVQVRYRTREKRFFSLSSLERKDNERRGIHLLFCDCLNGGLKSAKALERKSEVRRSRFPI
jgi:hypothetical protein